MTVRTHPSAFSARSVFGFTDTPSSSDLRGAGPVRFLVLHGVQDDGLWGPVGAVWLAEDRSRGGVLVHPWAPWAGSEIGRGYRSALERGWSHERIFGYWMGEGWRGSYFVEQEQSAETLALVAELVNAL